LFFPTREQTGTNRCEENYSSIPVLWLLDLRAGGKGARDLFVNALLANTSLVFFETRIDLTITQFLDRDRSFIRNSNAAVSEN